MNETTHTLTGTDAEARILYEEVAKEFNDNYGRDDCEYFRYELYIAKAMLTLASSEPTKSTIVAVANAIYMNYLKDEKRINTAFRNLVRMKAFYSAKPSRQHERSYGWDFSRFTDRGQTCTNAK